VTYLDHASTTHLHPAARAAMQDAPWADPTRLYEDARRARMALDEARDRCARALGGRAEQVTFTSGGTEANLLAVRGGVRAALAARRTPRVVVGAIEQTSILKATEGLDVEVIRLGVDSHGLVSPEALAEALDDGASLVSIQLANGEIGTLQSIQDLAEIARANKAWFHSDATFAVGWTEVDVQTLGVDLLTVSGHHAMGPKGTGLLWVGRGVRIRPEIVGDQRERGTRSGMPALEAVIGLGAALDARASEASGDASRMRELTAHLRDSLPSVVEDVLIHGHPTQRLPHIVSFTVPLVEGEALLLGLDQAGFAVHSGSACVADTSEPSHVLAAIGTLTHGAIRVSIGPETTLADIDAFLATLSPVVDAARAKLKGRS
jgi:cysteine desulfurase